MRIRKQDLTKVIRGEMTIEEAKRRAKRSLSESLLREQLPPTQATNPDMLENDSLDAQIDRFLMQGETNKNQQEMGMTPPGQEAPTQESFGLDMDLILEQGEDPAAAAGATDPAGGQANAGAPPAPEGPENPPPGEPAQPSGKELDAMTFADNVARLVEKYESLLDIKGTITRRALNWVTKNYDAKQSKEVAQILQGNFGITPEYEPDQYEDDQAPPAKGAGSGLNA